MPTFKPAVLLIEDDDYKVKALSDFFLTECPQATLHTARSLNGAIREICEGNFALAVVDMSLPTYDLATDRHGGGDPQGFAGEDILRFIETESPDTRMVVVTQLSEFSDGSVTRTLDELTAALKSELGANYLGLVSYSGRHGGWRDTLKELIQGITF